MISVFFPYYNCGDKERQKEIDLCLMRNADNKHIKKLYVVIDDGSSCPVNSDNVQVLEVKSRLTYKIWVELTQRYCSKGVSILCNSDIYFDDSLPKIYDVLSQPKSFIALSRWELLGESLSKHPNPHWSQDTWAMNVGEEFSASFLWQIDFPMGVPRCDNKIAYLFAIQGWKIFNPVDHLTSVHVHETQMRTYHKKLDDRILGGVAYVHPGKGQNDEATLDFDVWTKRTANVNKVTVNKSMEKWIAEAIQQEKSHSEVLSTWASVNIQEASAKDVIEAIKKGKPVFSHGINFEVLECDNNIVFKNLYEFGTKLKVDKHTYQECSDYCNVAGLIPPVLKTYVDEISLKSDKHDDVNFWQYPCATEKQAYENHLSIPQGKHINVEDKTINIYVPLPWATYIDKKNFPEGYLRRIKALISMYRHIALQSGFTLRVHSVCQHIHWVRILEKAQEIGVTDLHLSHKNSESEEYQREVGTSLTLHGWTLIAVNFETPERSEGMERKPMPERKLLASFIGAHMPHYRDDSRVKLFEAAKACGRDDVFVDLGNEWHFNKVVYEEQVLNKEIESHHIDEHHQRTFRYNSILSDSRFSLCPEGAGPNTLRFWESIAVGSIPVILSTDLSIFNHYKWGSQLLDNIFVWHSSIDEELFKMLANFDENELTRKSNKLKMLYNDMRELRAY